MRLWLQVECGSVAELLAGRAFLIDADHRPLFVRIARMLFKPHMHGFRPLNETSDLVIWSPRDLNPVADHAVNATMDTNRQSWSRVNSPALTQALRQRASLRVCIDGGRRSQSLGAVGFAVYQATIDTQHVCTYQLLLRRGRQLDDVASAFLAEALATEWALECLSKLVEGVARA